MQGLFAIQKCASTKPSVEGRCGGWFWYLAMLGGIRITNTLVSTSMSSQTELGCTGNNES